MTTTACALFPTAIGACAIAWTDRGVSAVFLPDVDEERTLKGLRAKVPAADVVEPTGEVAIAIRLIREHLAGRAQDLSTIRLDLSGLGTFDARVYELARAIPPGQTVTYGELARSAGSAGAARAVGMSMGRNPFPIVVPCHRVVAKGGAGGFSAPGGLATKARLLALEGVTLVSPGAGVASIQPRFRSRGRRWSA